MPGLIFDSVHGEHDPALLDRVWAEVSRVPRFTLWLEGVMGAGKTSFVRGLLYRQGLHETTPVVSPTYTLLNEYQIGEDWFAHLDLYRADETFSLAELGVQDVRDYRGLFVEWPEQGGPTEILPATHRLRITADDWERRRYELFRIEDIKD